MHNQLLHMGSSRDQHPSDCTKPGFPKPGAPYAFANGGFDGEETEPYMDEDAPNPISANGRSKLQGERYVQEIFDHY